VSWNFSQVVCVEYPNGLLFLSPLKNLISRSKQSGSVGSGLNFDGLSTHSVYYFLYLINISLYLYDKLSSPGSPNSRVCEEVYVKGY